MDNIDFSNKMEPIIQLMVTDMETHLEGTILKACQNVGVDVDRDRLILSLNNARRFYDDGYVAGYIAGKDIGRQISREREAPMRPRRDVQDENTPHWKPTRDYCPKCGKQQKTAKRRISKPWYCERCGQKLSWEVEV